MINLIDQNTGEAYHIPESNVAGVKAYEAEGSFGYNIYLIEPLNVPNEGQMVEISTGTKENQPQAVKQVRKYLGYPLDGTAEDWSSS